MKPIGYFTDDGKKKPITGKISGFGNSASENGARKNLLRKRKNMDDDAFRKKQIRDVVLSIEEEYREIRGNDSKLRQAKVFLQKAYEMAWNQTDKNGKKLYETDPKLEQRLSRLQSDIDDIIELRKLSRGTKIYVSTVGFSSTSTGNHAQMLLHYVKGGELVPIRLWGMDMKETKNGFVYTRHGGNYSFSHDLVYSLANFLHPDKKDTLSYFKDEKIS